MDYRRYQLSRAQLAGCVAEYLMFDGVISFLFFRSWIAYALLLPGMFGFVKMKRREKQERRARRLGEEFLTGIQAVSNALTAGYSVENAFEEAYEELKKVYADSMVVEEFHVIVTQLALNRTLEELLADLAERSGEEDIRSFAEIFAVAKRSGGDLNAIIRNTAGSISQKAAVRQEIEVCLSQKKLEQKVMAAAPLFILAYVGIASPDFLEVMYHNTLGVVVMGVCLAVYGGAWALGRRMVEIEV